MQGLDEPARILVVDDEAEMAEVIAENLHERGYDTVSVSSSAEALRLLKEARIDALVTDLRMPEIDGLALLRASRALDPSRPVIVITAYGSLSTAMQAVDDGTWHYLTKPFRLDVLARLLEQALSAR